ncbi:oligosaccharide flippase family protein [Candidatus Nephthysia bennettiae]|uniref:Oligosaccharide flippase family protein n=1 Tax=Candidatus Nephthysia bennettiae TaxID=3127016 RepID=A0A934N9M9_9BACT|nr:oligosaccharide flippase family protein [Candidatus Dormibacteraeota bacterium]MBJ7611775.1 oligosaccharide flippase family protein [Candidatus Dormibacteraeota bacterium]
MTVTHEPAANRGLAVQFRRVRGSRLVRQNLVLFIGGFLAGAGGFVYHSIAGRALGPEAYGEVSALVGVYTVGATINLMLVVVLARYAATLKASGRTGAIRHIMDRTARVIAMPAVLFCLVGAALSIPAASFLQLRSPVPLIMVVVAIAAYWYTAIPRGVLQGSQRFTALSANLSFEILVRTGLLVVFLGLGLAVFGATLAILAGVVLAFGLGLYTLRDVLAAEPDPVRVRTMATFAITATAGTLGISLLYNADVVLAKHFLGEHDAGIYGSLNKIGTILFYGTLSVSQVLFPRVLEAVAKRDYPGRLLLLSAGIMTLLGLCAIAVFAAASGLVVGVLYGPKYQAAQPFLLAVGFVGLGWSLNNLLVQFFMAVHDRVFIGLLAAGCALEVILIVTFHAGVGQVVQDVVIAVFALLGALSLRLVFLLPRLQPEMLLEEDREV